MGTRLDMILPGISDEYADDICLHLKSVLSDIEEKISIYKPESLFSRINDKAYFEPVKIEEYLLGLFEELLILSIKTRGYFDFSLGKLMRFYKRQPDMSLPDNKEEFNKLISTTGTRFIFLDKMLATISFKTENIMIDSGSFGKGFGLDKIKSVFNSYNISSYFISFGESSILASGCHPYGDSWKTGVRNIFRDGENVISIGLKDEFLSVSGITPQNLKKYGMGHLLNPVTGKYEDTFKQVVVKGRSGLFTEALSTALAVAPLNMLNSIMDEFPDYSSHIFIYNGEAKNAELIYSKISNNE